ncbi:DUF922 domain-containing Zn-dependent protease [Psychromonas aquimarina]|uniref:DUF922 domain-containing Zn-dependent protease n=1 Tax=Psychromonas aquimarina TaxID=444919 RepID=UPI000416E392|nr:DUF922 domain-containing protein [Psychromonas aquimarina]
MLSRLFFLLLCSAALNTAAEPIVNTNFTYYSVDIKQAESAGEMSKILSKASPVSKDGKKVHGHTKWFVKWNFRWKKEGGVCWVTKVTSHVDLTYTMPKALTLPVNETLWLSYLSYYDALFRHEKGHADYAVNAAKSIESSLYAMTYEGNCKLFTNDLNAQAYMVLNTYKELSEQYDRITENGRTQGVFLN